jgi:glycosyltransferase involved in cell wall biosynthesis
VPESRQQKFYRRCVRVDATIFDDGQIVEPYLILVRLTKTWSNDIGLPDRKDHQSLLAHSLDRFVHAMQLVFCLTSRAISRSVSGISQVSFTCLSRKRKFLQMRILVLSDVSGFMLGGVPVETIRLIRGLDDRGHHAALISDSPLAGTGPVKHFHLDRPVDGRLTGQLREAVNSFKPNLVHVMGLSVRGLTQLGPLLKEIPWVLTCHSVPPYERKLAHLHWNENAHYAMRLVRFAPNAFAWKWLFRSGSVPHAIVHSQSTAEIVERYGQTKTRIHLIPLGCEPGQDAPRTPRHIGALPLRLATIGGIAHTKGYHDELTALADVRHTIKNFEYTIIGEPRDESYMRYLRKLIERFRLENAVRFLLNATDAEKNEVLHQTDIYLQPSHEEGFCLSYIEAASIVPLLIGTDTGAIRSISANDVGARVVADRQPKQIADAIRQLSTIPQPADLLSQRRTRLANEFSWSKHARDHERLYQRIIESPSAASANEAATRG